MLGGYSVAFGTSSFGDSVAVRRLPVPASRMRSVTASPGATFVRSSFALRSKRPTGPWNAGSPGIGGSGG